MHHTVRQGEDEEARSGMAGSSYKKQLPYSNYVWKKKEDSRKELWTAARSDITDRLIGKSERNVQYAT